MALTQRTNPIRQSIQVADSRGCEVVKTACRFRILIMHQLARLYEFPDTFGMTVTAQNTTKSRKSTQNTECHIICRTCKDQNTASSQDHNLQLLTKSWKGWEPTTEKGSNLSGCSRQFEQQCIPQGKRWRDPKVLHQETQWILSWIFKQAIAGRQKGT
jgi:hypothetical protein